MASVNKAIVVGHLGRDPEMRYLQSGEAVANLAVATSEKYKDKGGQMQEHTEWHRINFFGRTAEVCGQYLKKGSLVYIEGSLRTRKWTDKDGVDKYTTEIRGDRMQMLGGKSEAADDGSAPASNYTPPSSPEKSTPSPRGGGSSGFDDMDDDIPFVSGYANHDVIGQRLARRLRHGR